MNKKRLSLIIIVIIFIINFTLFYFNEPLEDNYGSNYETGFVSKVIDGDTVVIDGESVRLLGMDTDERGEPCYSEAKKRLEELVLNKEVNLEKDGEDRDQYDRRLRWIFIEIDARSINVDLLLVEEGLAIARFYDNKKYKEEIIKAEQEARENKIGCKWKNL
ncbi:MAG: thermonuclease family protein [archaeon]